ncbi:MAG TPA: hypothetical protein VNE82_21780 [Candidatus Binataceae bacterium]|nr:hypothetical protein [Candidatus Binataceae bacterium]HVB82566.1 hypothetical protein [Candidatus Binataceae bacterium]
MRRINTARGAYFLRLGSELEETPEAVAFTIVLERADGIEQVALRCLIPTAQLSDLERDNPEEIEQRLEPWLQSGFEQIREAALKSIRSERQLSEVRFIDAPGPLRTA